MQDLLDLVEFIQKTKFKSNTLLDALIKPDSQMGKIYQTFVAGEVCTDQELLDRYPEMKSLKQIGILKTRLKNRLCDAVFLLDFREESYPDRQVAFVECVKKWSAAMILISKNIRSIGVKQLENLLRITLDFEFTEMSINIIRTLELYYATIEGDQKKYNELESLLRTQEAIWLAERQAEHWYSDLMINHVNSWADKHLAAQKAEEYFEKVETYMQQYPAFKIHFFGYLIQAIIYDGRNDFDGMSKVCANAIAFFDQKKYQSGMVLQTFYYNLVSSCLYSRQFERGKPYVQALEEMIAENSFNWFKVQELYFLMAMHTGNFQVTLQILVKVQANPYLSAQPAHIVELWKVFEAYVYFLVLAGKIKETTAEENQLNFKISRFLNEVPLLSKDKRGMNVTVLVIQYLYYVIQRRLMDCEARMESLNKYCTRYLNDETTLRSRYFIKMLLQIPTALFNLQQIRTKTAKVNELLQQVPWHTANQHREIEIIPYEQLWDIVLNSLQAPASGDPTGHSGKNFHLKPRNETPGRGAYIC